jgi:hypothetical protein
MRDVERPWLIECRQEVSLWGISTSGQSNNQWVCLVLMVPFYTLLFPSLIVVMASSAETGKVGILSSISIARWTVPFHILFVDYYLREPSTLLI